MFLKSVLLILNFCLLVNARGRMIDPPHRGNMWQHGFDVPANYDDMSLNCGGIDNHTSYENVDHAGHVRLDKDSVSYSAILNHCFLA
jgi:hypothetical protein